MKYFSLLPRGLKILLPVASIGFCSILSANAQTCRIKCSASIDGQGVSSYIEVYEYDYVDEKPSFPGGNSALLEFINKNRHYPKSAYSRKIEGRVTCQFVVNTDGSVSNLHIVRGVERSLNDEALRILAKMPDWTPGRHEGQPVPVRVIWAVPFRL